MAGGYLNISTSVIKSIPLPKKRNNDVIKIVDEIIKNEADLNNLKPRIENIDILIYKDFNIMFDEVLLIDPEFNLNQTEYDNFKV